MWLFADPLNGTGKAEADGTEVTTSAPSGRVTGHGTLGPYSEAPNSSHPSMTGGLVPGFPDDTNTGVQPGIQLNARGDWDIVAAGTYQGYDVTGYVEIHVSNVTLRNCRIRPKTGQLGGCVHIMTGATAVTVEYCDIDGLQLPGLKGVWIEEANAIVRFCEISHCDDGVFVYGSNTQIRDNYIHDLDSGDASAHHDCVQSGMGVGQVVDHNTMFGASNGNACFQIGNPDGNLNMTISNNLLRPGPDMLYLINCGDIAGPNTCVYNVTGNRMQAGHVAVGQGYVTWNVNRPTTWSGNVDADTGAAIPPPP